MKNYTTIFLTAILIFTASAFSASANSPGEPDGGAPTNDSFAAPTNLILNGISAGATGNNPGASKEAGEPNHADNAGGKSVWFTFTPAATTAVRINVMNTTFDTLLAVYTGASVDNLTLVGSNDNCSNTCDGASTVDLMLTGGQTYRIAVDGANYGSGANAGSFSVAVLPLIAPIQDNLPAAYDLGSNFTGSIAGTNYSATAEAGEPNHFEAATRSVWYRWTAGGTGSMDFELTENFNSSVAVYRAPNTQPTFAQLQQVVSAVDATGFTNSRYRVTFRAEENTTYFIAVDGHGSAAQNFGNFQLRFYPHRFRYSYRSTAQERTSLLVFRPGNGTWYNFSQQLGIGGYRVFGVNGDTPVPADYNGDGIADFAVTRNVNGSKIWYVNPSSIIGNSFSAVQWGAAGDKAMTGDFDRDGIADMVAIRQTANGLAWYIRRSSDGGLTAFNWGANSDKPVVGDFDGDRATDLAVTRSVNGNMVWYILKSGYNGASGIFAQATFLQFGFADDRIVAEDYDGDLKTDIAVFRPSNGTWYVLRSSDNQLQVQQFGTAGDKPQPADYSGDGKADFGVFRPSNGTWYTSLNPATNYGATRFGTDGDIPLASMATLSE